MRETEVYISYEVKSLLLAIAKGRNSSADAVADDLLRDIIYKLYPRTIEVMRQINDLKKEMVKGCKQDESDNNPESSTLQNLETQGRMEAPRTKA